MLRATLFLWASQITHRVVQACPVECVCDEHDKTAVCNAVELDTVPHAIPWFVQEVYLQDNTITGIPRNVFPSRANLHKLTDFSEIDNFEI